MFLPDENKRPVRERMQEQARKHESDGFGL